MTSRKTPLPYPAPPLTHRLQVAVYDALLEQQPETLDHGGGELPDEGHRHALVVVLLDQLKQV